MASTQKTKNTKTTLNKKYQQITQKREKSLRSSCEGFDNRTLPREFRLNAFLIAWVLVWISIIRCPRLYYRIQLSMVFGKTFRRLKILLPLEQNHFLQVWCALEEGNLQGGAHCSHLLQPWKENSNSHQGGLYELGQCFQRKALGKKCNKFMREKKKLQLVRSITEVQVTLICFYETLSHPPHNSFKSRSDSLTDGSKLWATLLPS